MKRALITGAGGSIGWYLRTLLAGKGYVLHTHWGDGAFPKHRFDQESCYSGFIGLNSNNFGMVLMQDEAYILHMVRPSQLEDYPTTFAKGLMVVAEMLKAEHTKIMIPGSIRELDREPTPWHINQRFTRELVEQFPNAMMPLLGQYISSRGNPKRMYLMQILHELAAGIEPTPLRPSDWIQLGHARDGARFLWETLNGIPTTYVAESMQVGDFIDVAKTPGTWINEIVEELKSGRP